MTFVDTRDGHEYKTVKLRDGNIWLAENLRFEVGESYPPDSVPEDRVGLTNQGCNPAKCGRLNTWQAAQRAAPRGWHVPSASEWKRLFNSYGGCARGIHDPAPELNEVPVLVKDMD